MPAKFSLEHGHRPCSSQCSRVSVESPGPDLSVGGWLTCFLCKPGGQGGEILSLWIEFHVKRRCKVREFFLWARPAKSMRWLIIAPACPPRKEKVLYRRTVRMSMCTWLSNRANWAWQRVAFAELCQDFIPSYKVSIFIIEYLLAQQFSGFF